jgi:hypothetical protein
MSSPRWHLSGANVADRVSKYSEFPHPKYRSGNDRLGILFPAAPVAAVTLRGAVAGKLQIGGAPRRFLRGVELWV